MSALSETPAMASARRILADPGSVGFSDARALTHIFRTSAGMAGVWDRAEEEAWYRAAEWRRIAGKLEAAYAAVMAGDDSPHTRERIGRLEALQAALQGFPDALAQ